MAEGGVNFSEIDHSSIHIDTVVGGNQTIINQFLSGPDKLPTDYSTRIKNFLREYLGDDKNKVPFGGRTADLATLNQWLADPNAPTCLFMSAEAGRGKSALLARWATYLQQFDDIEVVFIPISIRFETAAQEVFYTALAARLAVVYGDEVKYSQLSAEQWKGTADNYLQRSPPDGKQVVVIIDGLDEATGWQAGAAFMPLPLPERVRVVASKRVQAEENVEVNLRQLGWQMQGTAIPLTLEPLTREGVKDVLIQMGNPLDGLVTKVDVIGELFRLTDGDPLLVRLYVDGLVGQGEQVATLTAEQLKDIEPGLKGYFEQWEREQHQKWEKEKRNPLDTDKVLAFFNAVATSFGPLSRRDVLEITKSEKISGVQLKAIAKEVGRFIIGDGESQGYTFSHPRLGYYFFDQLGDAEKEDWNSRFVNYGESFLKKIQLQKKITWSTKEIEPHTYVIQHYSAHLDRANAPRTDYYALICHEWAQAWSELTGVYEGFLGDVQRVWQKATNDPIIIRRMTTQIWCALCKSSIYSISNDIPMTLLAGAIKAGVMNIEQLFTTLSQNNDAHKITETLSFILKEHKDKYLIADKLLQFLEGIANERQKTDILISISSYVPDKVLNIAKEIRDEALQVEVLCALAPHVPEEIIKIVENIKNDEIRVKILCDLAKYYPLEVLKMTEKIKDDELKNPAIVYLANHLPKYILKKAESLNSDTLRIEILRMLAPHLPHKILKIAYKFKYDQTRAYVFDSLASIFPEIIYNELQNLVNSTEKSRADIMVKLAKFMPDKILEISDNLWYESSKSYVWSNLARYRPHEVLDKALNIQDENYRNYIFVNLAPHLPQKMLNIIQFLDDYTKAGILMQLADDFPNLVFNYIKDIKIQELQIKILGALAPYMPEKVLDESQSFPLKLKVDLINCVLPYLSETSGKSIYRNLIGESQRNKIIGDEQDCIAMSLFLVPYLNKEVFAKYRKDLLLIDYKTKYNTHNTKWNRQK